MHSGKHQPYGKSIGKKRTSISVTIWTEEVVTNDETLILYRAAGILRSKIANREADAADKYISATELNLQGADAMCLKTCMTLSSWCTSDEHYRNVTNSKHKQDPENADLCVITICHSMMGITRNQCTPMMLGLAVHIHHEVGSKKLTEVLQSGPLCIL